MRKMFVGLVPLVVAAGLFWHWEFRSAQVASGLSDPQDSAAQTGRDDDADHSDSVRLATFNIQVFGVAKLKRTAAMSVLSQIVRRFDVVAIQEVRAKDQSVVSRFVSLINADGSRYAHVLGPRLGRSSSKEQYAYIYNLERIELLADSVYTINDPRDYLHREPLVARFRVRGPPVKQALTFTLINIHTDPDEVVQEINVLDNVFEAVRRDASREDDVIMLGDFNADEKHYGELGRLPGLQWAIAGQNTNTRMTRAYDNILFDRRATSEFTGRSGVLNFMQEFQLSRDQALIVSDHMPVWAEFSGTEDVPAVTRDAQPTAADSRL